MPNPIRIKRRAATGAAGAPSSLLGSELAYNEQDNTLYYGFGIASGSTAASVIPIAGSGAFANLTTAQTLAGVKTFSSSPVIPTVVASDNSTNAASTAFVKNQSYLVGNQSISFTGDATGTGSTAVTLTLANTAVVAGSYTKVTVDAKGRVTAGLNMNSGDITTALAFTPENSANKGAANGYAGLDAGGKVPAAQLPASVTGGLNYQGTWNATTNTPALANGVGTKGFYYKVTVAGNTTIDGDNNWTIGDLIVYSGTEWDKIEGGTSDVVSVAGKVGVVTLVAADVGGLGTMATQNANAVSITGGTIASAAISGNIAGSAANVTGTVAVANGGTGVTTITGLIKGSGTSPLSAAVAGTDYHDTNSTIDGGTF